MIEKTRFLAIFSIFDKNFKFRTKFWFLTGRIISNRKITRQKLKKNSQKNEKENKQSLRARYKKQIKL